MLDPGYLANYQILQSPGYVTIIAERLHEARAHPPGWPPVSSVECAFVDWVLAGPLGGQYARGRNTKLERQDPGGGRGAQCVPINGATEDLRVIERFTRQGRRLDDLSVHPRGCETVGADPGPPKCRS